MPIKVGHYLAEGLNAEKHLKKRRDVRRKKKLVLFCRLLKKIYEYTTSQEHRIIDIEVFYSKVEKTDYVIDQFEIIDAKWFDIRHPVPIPHSRSFPEIIQKFLELKNNGL